MVLLDGAYSRVLEALEEVVAPSLLAAVVEPQVFVVVDPQQSVAVVEQAVAERRFVFGRVGDVGVDGLDLSVVRLMLTMAPLRVTPSNPKGVSMRSVMSSPFSDGKSSSPMWMA